MFVKKTLTLIELLISMVLFGIVILGVFGLYNTTSKFFTSSKTKSMVLNDLTYVLDHLDKNVYLSTGWLGDPAISVVSPSAGFFRIYLNQDTSDTPIDFSDDTTVRYNFNSSTNRIRFRDLSGSWNILTERLVNTAGLLITYDSAEGVLSVDNLCLRRDPSKPYDAKTNPEICITGQKFSTSMQSLQ
ncbi:MAG: prepilin-type N-terminal cleavage/methylation domain-containing protein [Candidatus Omnitrophica bacterium]|nr:prepilin-type N-terminal cleavage/methylation domain-containing protein [Candidatus Omnitrophota bacterium]MCF7891510.1 prepilin-type N-terminal cleavage/methylation domain-containing protein [Candidatus Omnitrophota bacterium]MCF7895777.1 prepilin-type N-terminal cleavage/methylation domain-containing protein [Candidatus Omnitrophota bacterium]MCF7897378.1 prepilin-type N-terminal cleavage/methylation domain-containing protein [Candidatus Omnitrophota bacterium]MCF7909515.1 prepilin-type N-